MNFLRDTKRYLVLTQACLSFAANAEPVGSSVASPLPDLSLTTVSAESEAVKGRDGWYFLSTEIEHLLTAQNQIPQAADSEAVIEIRNYADALKTLGIKLVLMPIPEKALIRMDGLIDPTQLPEAKGYSRATRAYLDELTKNDIDVIDLYDKLSQSSDPIYCKTDSHFTPKTAARISGHIIKHIAERFPEVPIKSPSADPESQASVSQITIKGDLAGNEAEETLELHTAPECTTPVNQPGTITKSPILLMGDSHLLVYNQGKDMHASGAGIVDHLTPALGYAPDVISNKGDGINAPRIKLYRDLKKNPDLLKDKKLIIWCFAAKNFSQQQWKKVGLP
jgi:alginate O-acetyltransferase complex protein AlgJ